MKFHDLPATAHFLDVEGIAVVDPGGSDACLAFRVGEGLDVESRVYPNHAKATLHGDRLTRDEFAHWLKTGKNKFDT